MRIFEGKVNFLMICFKFCSSRIPLVFEDQKKKKKGQAVASITETEAHSSGETLQHHFASLESEVCGYFAVFLAARCPSSDWLEAKGRILDDARKADNQTCYECQPEAEETLWLRVFLSFSLFLSIQYLCASLCSRKTD